MESLEALPITSNENKCITRSPIYFADKVSTPTLNIAGARVRCTPANEAIQFHQALLENGVESSLVIYPEEGHGVKRLPAIFDYAARVVGWFERHMPANPSPIELDQSPVLFDETN